MSEIREEAPQVLSVDLAPEMPPHMAEGGALQKAVSQDMKCGRVLNLYSFPGAQGSG